MGGAPPFCRTACLRTFKLMSAYGANTGQLDAAKSAFLVGSMQLETTCRSVTELLSQTFWLGPAASGFVDRWNHVHAPSLRRSSQSLDECAQSLARNREEQLRASAATGGVAGAATSATQTSPTSPTGRGPTTPGTVSAADRIAANRRQMEAELASGAGDTALLKQLLDGNVKVLLWDPKNGHIATLQGDLESADYVIITVPGTGANANQYTLAGKETERAELLLQTATNTNKKTAVIAWLGYDAPQLSVTNSPAEGSMAVEGGKNLANFVANLGLADGQKLGVLGHSYGSTVVGYAAANGMPVDNLVVIGSPGVGVNSVGDLGLQPGAQMFAMRLDRDPVGALGAFGTDPSSIVFGAQRLDGTTNQFMSHSDYWNATNIQQLAGALTDGKPKTVIGPQSAGEFAVAGPQALAGVVNRGVDTIQPILPAPAEWVVDSAQGVHQKINGVVQTVAVGTVDTTVYATKAVAGAVVETTESAVEDLTEFVGDVLPFVGG
jgi:pimeloyl-ACP methyl ester carboxylesterase